MFVVTGIMCLIMVKVMFVGCESDNVGDEGDSVCHDGDGTDDEDDNVIIGG